MSSSLPLSAKARRTGEQPISFLMVAAIANPKLINLAAGLVDPQTLPVAAVRQIAETLLSDPARGRAALQYDTTLGFTKLRKVALAHLEELEQTSADQMSLTDRDILITTGSQQALYLVGDVLIDPGDIVIAANPCYFVYSGTLASLGATVLTVPMGPDGIDVPAIERLLEKLKQSGRLEFVKMIYTTSYFQNPTGLSMSAEGRRKLVEVVRKYSKERRIMILEDAAYRELRYDGPALQSMKPLDDDNEFTILTQTFSKPFAPGLRTGYTAMPADLLEAVLHQKGNHDFGSASLTQHIAAEALTSGLYAKQVRTLCENYRKKRDAMLAAMDKHLPASLGATWTRPHGGLYVWVTLPKTIDAGRESALFRQCIERGVIYVPGEYSYQPDEFGIVAKNHLRLSFGQVDFNQIEPGIARFGEALRSIA
jgi:2-aminoadipate transaminase